MADEAIHIINIMATSYPPKMKKKNTKMTKYKYSSVNKSNARHNLDSSRVKVWDNILDPVYQCEFPKQHGVVYMFVVLRTVRRSTWLARV